MKIRVLLFALYRDLAGTEELEIEIRSGATAAELVDAVRKHPGLSILPPSPALAINQEYAPLATALNEGDEVALLPPVAGG